jgi:hypothetical protein
MTPIYMLHSLKKTVSFNLDNNEIYDTYHRTEYDRSQIDHVLYRRAYNRVSNEEWNNIYITLDLYKLYEMPVHKDSLHNNVYQAKKVVLQRN